MANINERIAGIETKIDEARTEIMAELDILRNENLSDEGRAAFNRVEAKVTAMADISPPVP